MITPFTEDNKIDYDAVLRIIEWYDKNGVDGIFAVCQSSEMFELSPQERVELAKFIINNTPKHMGVIASGHCAEKVEDQIREAQTVIDAGVDAYVFISNQFAKENESEDVAKKNIEYLLDHIDGDMFGVYECPAPYKRLLSPELLKWCAETEKFAFSKDTCCDLDQLEAKCKAVEGTGLKILMQMQQHFFAAWKWDVQDTRELWQTSIRIFMYGFARTIKSSRRKHRSL